MGSFNDENSMNRSIVFNDMTMKEKLEPDWILDRRDSGRLFWRRDSGGASSASNRVKFRCDVEILEFLRNEHEASSEDEDEDGWGAERRWLASKEEIPPPSSLVGGLCVVVIIAVLTYQWWFARRTS
ncbi:hypothetical protein LSTR_LSTR012399 [Laodelphax striatellus]|uniref:Uncharacterized protein n=1 Tax=Laodelphax striatellus TaxID=195883 RepID=A0A482WUT1_LAOST|nr:hypothetical protein LSTR_LSTR012399 [Laodelphax striatellus]